MDEGKMFIVGNGKLGNGRWGTFKLTEKKEYQSCCKILYLQQASTTN